MNGHRVREWAGYFSAGVRIVAELPQAPEQEVAPTHADVREHFSDLLVAICVGLGGVAIVLGIVLGIIITND